MIKTDAVSVAYGRKPILEKISFSAEKSAITVILGKNGCGKSTLLKALAGNLSYKGSITVGNRELSAIRPADRAKMISFMPQMMHAPAVTVREFVAYGRQPYTGALGILSQTDRDIVETSIRRADVTTLSDKYVNRISGGERQRVYFALMLSQNTDIILLDEPGSHLDAQHNRQLADFLKTMAGEGKTVVAVMHDINCALEIADRIIFLDGGAVIFNGTPSDFADSGIAEKVLGLKKLECTSADGSRTVFL